MLRERMEKQSYKSQGLGGLEEVSGNFGKYLVTFAKQIKNLGNCEKELRNEAPE